MGLLASTRAVTVLSKKLSNYCAWGSEDRRKQKRWRKEGQLWPHSVQTTSKMRPSVLEAKALWSPTIGLPAGLPCRRSATSKATFYNLSATEPSKTWEP